MGESDSNDRKYSKRPFSAEERFAVFVAYGATCFYCCEPLAFCDMEVDHIIPESLLQDPDRLRQVLRENELAEDFSIISAENWVSAHAGLCNRRKSNSLLPKASLHFFLALSSRKGDEIRSGIESLANRSKKAHWLGMIDTLISSGRVTEGELLELVRKYRVKAGEKEPLVAMFHASILSENLASLSDTAPKDFWGDTCDWLMARLLGALAAIGRENEDWHALVKESGVAGASAKVVFPLRTLTDEGWLVAAWERVRVDMAPEWRLDAVSNFFLVFEQRFSDFPRYPS